MRRLTSIDFLRGIAIFFTLVFHFLFTNWDAFANTNIDVILNKGGVPLLIVAILIAIFIHWRGFFLMISAIVNFYAMERALKKGKNIWVIWTKQIIAGIVLILVGKLWITFFPYWGVLESWSRSTTITLAESWTSHKGMFFMIEAIESIGLMMIVTSFLFLIFATKKLKDNWMIKAILGFGIGIIVIIISPYVSQAIVNVYGLDITTGENFSKFTTPGYWWIIGTAESQPLISTTIQAWSKVWRVPLNWLVGREAPLFPMMGSYFIGAGMGTILTQDEPKKKQYQWLYLVGGILTVLGLIDWIAFYDMDLNLGFHVHPRWFALFAAGLQIIVITAMVLKIEFNRMVRVDKWEKGTRWVGRFGVFALTAYFFSIGDMVIRFIFQAIFPNQDFIKRYSLTFGWTILLLTLLMLSWHALLYVWDRYGKGYGSWEFFISLIRRPKGGQKRNWRDPINLRGILWDVETIMYVTPYTDDEYKQISNIKDKKKDLRIIKAPWVYFKVNFKGKYYPMELFFNVIIITIRSVLLSIVLIIQRIKHREQYRTINLELKKLITTF